MIPADRPEGPLIAREATPRPDGRPEGPFPLGKRSEPYGNREQSEARVEKSNYLRPRERVSRKGPRVIWKVKMY